MRLASAARVAHLFGLAVVSQILLSGTNFGVNFLLIRKTTDADYGMYVLVQSSIALLISAQSAWCLGPLAVVALKQPADRRREMVGSIRTSRARFLLRWGLVAMIVPIGSALVAPHNLLLAVVIGLGILACVTALERDFLRNALLMYRRPQDSLRSDISYCALLLAGTFIATWSLKPAAEWTIAALVLAAITGAWIADRAFSADPGWVSGDAKPVWDEMRSLGIWSVVGAVVYWLFTQSYNSVLAARLNLSAVAAINAARLLLMPPIVLTVGVSSLLLPSAAAWMAQLGFAGLVRRLLAFIVGLGTLDILYFVAVWMGRDWLTGHLLHKTIPDRDRLLILWAGVAFIGLLRDIFQSTLFSLGHQKLMAWMCAAGAVTAITIMWIGIPRWGPAAALIGQIVGELINLAGLVALLRRDWRIYSPR